MCAIFIKVSAKLDMVNRYFFANHPLDTIILLIFVSFIFALNITLTLLALIIIMSNERREIESLIKTVFGVNCEYYGEF